MLRNPLKTYAHWLHLRWPAGKVERLPEVGPGGVTNVPGVRVVGDLTGIPLLKFSADTGARAVQEILAEADFAGRQQDPDVVDIGIIGGGVSGIAAAMEAAKAGASYRVFEAAQAFSTLVNFPKGKPIYTYPTGMVPAGDLQFRGEVKEDLVREVEEQRRKAGVETINTRIERIERRGKELVLHHAGGETTRCHRVIVAIGRSGNYRKLGLPGEERDKVYNRLHDPKEYADQDVLVVGGGDSALETAIALGSSGARVTLSYRGKEFSRPKPDNIAKLEELGGAVNVIMNSQPTRIGESEVVLKTEAGEQTLPNDAVFTMLGREAPLDFFRRSGLRISGERNLGWWLSLAAVLALFIFVYHWKKTGVVIAPVPGLQQIAKIGDQWSAARLFPYNVPDAWGALGGAFADPATLLGTLRISLGEPGFYYSMAYCGCVIVFGIQRIRRRRTPYVKLQTVTLALIQLIPLFLLPYIFLPLAGNNGWFESGWMASVANELFPTANYGHGREYWRAFGLILAWPLFFWNVFTSQPMWGWLAISAVQTFVIIPVILYFWGKGAYCGWICSCGALAETMGDAHRHKMPHGPGPNRLNFVGQVFMVFAFLLLGFRVAGWVAGPESWPSRSFAYLFQQMPVLNYVWFVDLLWAGILGVGLYWHFSGRVWCRFGCPLAALMHIYTRFSRFRIFAEKSKCISCNVCTSVCHQGIDVMSFANKGAPMADPQCVRCSACVQQCPTGVLSFGRFDGNGVPLLDKLGASPVIMREQAGKK